MRNITLLIALLICTVGFSQSKLTDVSVESNTQTLPQRAESGSIDQNAVPATLSERGVSSAGMVVRRAIQLLNTDPIEIQRELDASMAERGANAPLNSFVSEGQRTRSVMANIIPTAGAMETFAVDTGDFFYDPSDGMTGGPGGDCSTTSSGDPGDYPNCDCVTTTTLTGNNLEVEFLEFRVFGMFDFLVIYDGPDTMSPQIYDSNLNNDTDTLAGMIAANGSAIFTSSSGALTFEFSATAVVNTCGWEVEVLSGGGGGGGGVCPAPMLEVNQDVEDACMANISQTDLAQSYIPIESESAGAGIKTTAPSTGEDLTLSLWDALPNAGGTMLATGTTTTTGDVWIDVFWDPVVTVTPGNTYFITIEGTVTECIAGSTNNPYADGEVYANPGYQQFPNFDYTFRTYSCDGGGGGGCTPGVYADRASFNAEAGMLTFEDFAGGPGGIEQCGIIIDESGDGTCYAPGEIQPGIQITSTNGAGGQTVYVEAGNFDLPNDAVGSNTFTDATIINFPNNDVNSFGFDLYGLIGGSDIEIRIFGTGGLIDTQTVTAADPGGVFFGYIATETVVSLELEDLSGVTAELVAQFEFGDCSGGGTTNDECAGATPVACNDVIVGTTADNTDTGGNPAPDEWYSFTGSGSPQVVTVSLCDGGTDYDSLLRVFDACGGNEIATNDDSCGLQSELSFLSDGTSTYYIMVEGFGSNAGNFSMAITCIDPPPNDECTGAISMDCGETVVGETNTATFDASAPVCVTGITAPGVWYTFTDDTGLVTNYTLSMCDGGTDYDSKITVYSGDCGALDCVVDNDDSCGLQSEVSWQGDGSTTYYILVHGFGSSTGNFSMALSCAPVPPPNDMIVNSIDVDEIGFPYTDPAVAMPAATTENGNPAGCNLDGANGVWYNFVPDGDGFATAEIITPGGASSVTFYSAPDEDSMETDLTLVDWNGNQCVPGTSAIIPTVAGQAYYVFVLNNGAITDIVIDGNNLGLDGNAIQGFTYHPNPTDGVLNLNSVESIDNVAIFNLLGQQVLSQDVEATSTALDVSNLAVGAYVMKVSVNGQTGTYKIIKR